MAYIFEFLEQHALLTVICQENYIIECDARSFDSIIRRDIEVTDEDIKSLCEQMKEVAIANCKSNLQRSAVKDVTKNSFAQLGNFEKR